ncbi:armadillo-type protein [Russula earlei]|uniref:Armadillo-type protein n=1 Tax=Russula earlei TaxID=71964 RepID=A0ACC0TXW2_9AGAM|nr:armadillo-type protein [Russula earlei]
MTRMGLFPSRLVRECHQQDDERRIGQIVLQFDDMFSSITNALHIRNGGLIGLAGTAIALGVDIAPYMDRFFGPLLVCFLDPENRVRYFAVEYLYNIAKLSNGEVLVHFNPIFDALIKTWNYLSRIEQSSLIICSKTSLQSPPPTTSLTSLGRKSAVVVKTELLSLTPNDDGTSAGPHRAFSLSLFIPLLSDRLYVVSPFTRSFLVSWFSVLDSVPELEFITYLPHILDGLLKYLSDPTEDVRIAAENQLAEFLREIREVTIVRAPRGAGAPSRRLNETEKTRTEAEQSKGRLSDTVVIPDTERASVLTGDLPLVSSSEAEKLERDFESHVNERDVGDWVPGQGVRIDYAAIIEILIQQPDLQYDEIQQSTALLWLAELLTFTQDVMVPFTPRLIPAILPNLAHHVPMIQSSAIRTNKLAC